MKKIHEWLGDLNSHEIYDADAVADDFRTATGQEPCWSRHTVLATRAAIERRGLGGDVSGDDKQQVAYGYEIAASLALKHADYRSPFLGRGSQFRDCMGALKQKDA